MSNIERELKLVPASAAILDHLAAIDRLGPLLAVRRRREHQRNAFFDSSLRAFAQLRLGFRRRTIEGQPMAAWTIKSDGSPVRGVATRDEIELHLSIDTPPALAISALRQAAASRGAAILAEAVDEALRVGGMPSGQPFLETATDRRIVDLANDAAEVELALDEMRIVGHEYHDLEIEAELKRGNESALEDVRRAIEALGEVRESDSSKLARAVKHVETCACSG